MLPTIFTPAPLLQPTHMATYAGISYNQMKKEEKPSLGVSWLDTWMQAESGQQLHYSQIQGWPWKTVEIKIFPISRAGSSASAHWLCVEEKVAQGEKIYRFLGRCQWPSQLNRGLEENKKTVLEARRSGITAIWWSGYELWRFLDHMLMSIRNHSWKKYSTTN